MVSTFIKNTQLYASRTREFALAHKAIASVVAVAIVAGGYYTYTKLTSTAGETRYVMSAAEQGAIVASVTATGQMSASNQVDLKPKAGGQVVYVGVASGDVVRTGTLIASLDAEDARKAVRDAEINLQSATLSLQKLGVPADALSITQAQNALAQAQDDLGKTYDSSFTSISSTFLDLPAIMSGLNDVIYGTNAAHNGQANIDVYTDMVRNYKDTAPAQRDIVEAKYKLAQDTYTKALADYKNINRFSDKATIDASLTETYESVRIVAESIKATNDYLSFIKDTLTSVGVPSALTSNQASLSTYTTQTNSHLSDLNSIKATIATTQRSIIEKQQSLQKIQSGADPLDIASAKLTVQQRENALLDAKNTLANYYVTAPFNGTVASLPVKKFDSISSGTTVATLITSQKIAELSLNEVDAAKIKVGQKATLTFDAIDGLTLTGKVVALDTAGTVSQGVVSYAVKIALDTQDDRIKPGMSTSASIITNTRQDVVRVPSSAVKTQGDTRYVEALDGVTDTSATGVASAVIPRKITVEVGLADDTYVEITSGLKVGDYVVERTISGAAKTTTTAAPSLLGGGTRAATGGTRALGR